MEKSKHSDGEQTNTNAGIPLGTASEAAKKENFNEFFAFMLHASIFVCQFTQLDALS